MRMSFCATMIDTEEHEILLVPKYPDWLDHALLVVQYSDCIQPATWLWYGKDFS